MGVLAFAIFGIFASCFNKTNFNQIKTIPKLKQENYERYGLFDRSDFGLRFGHQLGHNSIKINVPKNVKILMLDTNYRVLDYHFFRKFNNWFEQVKFQNGIMAINQEENLDCDNFALLYKSLLSISYYKSNVSHEPAVATVLVEQKQSFGGVPAGGLHMLNLIFTSKAWYIFEPQTGQYTELENYPNQEHIKLLII
jgi:hypothetical protein